MVDILRPNERQNSFGNVGCRASFPIFALPKLLAIDSLPSDRPAAVLRADVLVVLEEGGYFGAGSLPDLDRPFPDEDCVFNFSAV